MFLLITRIINSYLFSDKNFHNDVKYRIEKVVMYNLNIDQTIEYVKNIVDNNQCTICDKTDGLRMRYSCGHTACDKCVTELEGCQICLTPPRTPSPQPKVDDAFTERVKNASLLLKACQDLFNTDVFQRKRLSERLRIEKELFPECIQAPVKYENKRKSSILSYKNKEKRQNIFSEEETSPSKENIKMDNSLSYVQRWLTNHDKDFSRKPLRDLNVNTQLDDNIILRESNNKRQSKKDNNVLALKTNRKRSHFKTIVKKHSPIIANRKRNNNAKKNKKGVHIPYQDVWDETQKDVHDNDESGIFMENDPIVIDDSQEIVNDKDRNAWLAVLEANKNEEIESVSDVNLDCGDPEILNCSDIKTPTNCTGHQSKLNQITKVPFYKKGYITETCAYCSYEADKAAPSKDVLITIDNDNFTTTIQILNNVKDIFKSNPKSSVSAQTDICEIIPMNHDIDIKDVGLTILNEKHSREDLVSNNSDTQSEDLFADEGRHFANYDKGQNIPNCLVIEESDSDMDADVSGPLPVKVDVHRSCDEFEYGILGEIVNIEEHVTRPRPGPRGLTPTSTDSSEKENFNPNRMKITTSKKKKYAKK